MSQAAAFIAVTLQRACHNSFIEWAKGDSPVSLYTVSSVIFVAQAVCVVIGWILAYQGGGSADLNKCFDTRNLMKFANIGMIYAMGDIFEMESVNYVDSSTYTVLSQAKLIITALLMWVIDGTSQSLMQWFILFTTSAGMLEYVLVGKKGGGMVISFTGVMLAMTKVMISCYVAVLNQKALKKDSNPFPVQFASLKVSWCLTSLIYMLVKDGLMGDGDLFGQWTNRTFVLVFAGFILKTLFNQYLLKVLDAIWKNISEAVGVLLVYFAKVTFLGGTFDATVFNAAVTVILSCIAYVLSKQQKAKKSDIGDEIDPTCYKDLQASLLASARLRSRVQ
eukprot:TRINITY_DN1639_c0_g1_i2.p1 TRINITY_DN1639_c0_g1~~TRINITY_DN1639_c0_g1_i2.p1  ORF type:complete len:362 (-),score=82.87 TRINITY_DN1639_c0_g1_i2:209-1213(-)